MRKLTLVLAILLTLLLGFVTVFLAGGTLSAQIHIQTANAAEYPEAYSAIRDLLSSGSAPQVFADALPGEDPAPYTLVDITLRLANRGLFPAEWLDLSAEAVEGDIAVYALTGEGSDIPARSASQVNLKLITTAPADAVRNITVQYHIYGMRRHITVR
ncbi:MAG: hypothetical protein Q4C10_03150 [Clostridia bacterium]|nr:hypothetical protein [Clostridia bacterium]